MAFPINYWNLPMTNRILAHLALKALEYACYAAMLAAICVGWILT